MVPTQARALQSSNSKMTIKHITDRLYTVSAYSSTSALHVYIHAALARDHVIRLSKQFVRLLADVPQYDG